MLIQDVIQHLLNTLEAKGFKTLVHFELEGVCELRPNQQKLDYLGINQKLARLGIDGELKSEYWKNQWEFVSLFNGQSPLKEAQNLAHAMRVLPTLMCQHGAAKVMMVPVAWGADKGRYVPGSGAIFSLDTRSVHIPNAIQMNVSVENQQGENLFAQQGLGEWIQYELLVNSYACCLLFLPEEDAFKRLALRQDYGLDAELSSPVVLSGGHQGSIALYKEIGKHNQAMGLEPLFFASDNSVLQYAGDWRKTARVEHRIGATSKNYDPYSNMLFILINVLEGINKWQVADSLPQFKDKALPVSLFDEHNKPDGQQTLGALSLFENETWFADKINFYCTDIPNMNVNNLGVKMKEMMLSKYQRTVIT
ncbi:hypothetical protein [Paraglaciecola sp. MB-3u-78]|uniref:hypothetical protein n=1 Tax=Paraglaciecola sp. MB-3u-78 TaxID=2058332 RepID=UPI000C3479A6|nr:hypothetical protein [Paraglaciecola sp. MB-3u-78]PKG93262.1 hypothetical protein CXF95_27195 [Paraglaciecola sp. MB-3u-78]